MIHEFGVCVGENDPSLVCKINEVTTKPCKEVPKKSSFGGWVGKH